MSKQEQGTKRPASVLDQMFEFPHVEKWRSGLSQKVLGSEVHTTLPANITGKPNQPLCIEFVLKSDEIFSFGPMSRFKVKGQFQIKSAADGEWEAVAPADSAKVVVAPNWFEMLIKDFDVFHGAVKIDTTNKSRFIWQHLNIWRYAFMNKAQRDLLCPEACHPGKGFPTKKGNDGWSWQANSEWRAYADALFKENTSVEFTYTPIDQPPFFQFSNYFQNGQVQKYFPMPIVDRLLIRFNFIDNQKFIFDVKPVAPPGHTPEFRFVLQELKLDTERLRLTPSFQAALLRTPKTLYYPGVTKIIQSELIPATTANFKCKIQSVGLPEGMIIFCLPKDVENGNYNYDNRPNELVFQNHNIEKVGLMYNEEQFFLTEPNLGTVREDETEAKIYNDMLWSPPFGVKTDPSKITQALVHDCFESTPYPMVFINLTNFGSTSRVVPFMNSGACLSKNHDLDLTLQFNGTRSAENVTYFICLYYTDVNLILDMKKKGHVFFSSPHIVKA